MSRTVLDQDREQAAVRQHVRRLLAVLGSLWYAAHVIFHPFDGFWDLKNERRGNVQAATLLLLLVTVSYVFMRQYTAFIHNERNLREMNLLVELASVWVPFMLWCAVNWALTTLMEGKGTFADIYISSAYALTPIILLIVPNTIISHGLTLQEGTFVSLFFSLAVIWSGALLVLSTMVVHEYSGLKTVVTLVLIAAGMMAILFLGLLFSALVSHMLRFVLTIYYELSHRWG